MREGYFLVRAPVWGRPQEFSKGFAARQQNLRLRPTRGLLGWWIAKFRVSLGQSAHVRFFGLAYRDISGLRSPFAEIRFYLVLSEGGFK